jgi:hypothetical protein
MFELLLPLACQWAEAQESAIIRDGVPLTAALLRDAQDIGMLEPRRVHLRVVHAIPLPDDPLLRAAAEQTGLLTPLTIGLTLRFGIYIRADHWGDRRLVVHELTHTAQYERLGGIEPFLRAYLDECLNVGYPNGPLEQEARAMEQRILSTT